MVIAVMVIAMMVMGRKSHETCVIEVTRFRKFSVMINSTPLAALPL